MAIVKWNTAIDYVKGALAKPKKDREGHSCGDYLIGTHREAPTTNPNCTRAFVRAADSYKRTTPYSQEEKAAQNLFSRISKGIAARKQNIETMLSDREAFLAQKDSPSGYKTFYQYLWHTVADSLN